MSTTMVAAGARGRRSAWSTLRMMRSARLVIFVLIALLLIVVGSATEAHRNALEMLGERAAPSVLAAEHIQSAMAAMDAGAAEAQLHAPVDRAAAADAYERRREEAARALITAAENITHGQAEREPVESLQVGLGTYERLLQKARDLNETGGTANSAPVHGEATSLMNARLRPAAEALERVNSDALERSVGKGRMRLSAARFLIMAGSAALLVALVWAQMMLSQRTQRTFNPWLLAATLLTVLVAGNALRSVDTSDREMELADTASFSAMRDLWHARTAAFQAAGEQSRALLDPSHSADHSGVFRSEAEAVATLPQGMSMEQLLAALRERRHVEGFNGFLAEVLNHVAVRGEREAALRALQSWGQFTADEEKVHAMEIAGQRKGALTLQAEEGAVDEGGSLARFDAAVGQTLSVDAAAFQTEMEAGSGALRGLTWKTAAGTSLLIVLVSLGFAPRLREYR